MPSALLLTCSCDWLASRDTALITTSLAEHRVSKLVVQLGCRAGQQRHADSVLCWRGGPHQQARRGGASPLRGKARQAAVPSGPLPGLSCRQSDHEPPCGAGRRCQRWEKPLHGHLKGRHQMQAPCCLTVGSSNRTECIPSLASMQPGQASDQRGRWGRTLPPDWPASWWQRRGPCLASLPCRAGSHSSAERAPCQWPRGEAQAAAVHALGQHDVCQAAAHA